MERSSDVKNVLAPQDILLDIIRRELLIGAGTVEKASLPVSTDERHHFRVVIYLRDLHMGHVDSRVPRDIHQHTAKIIFSGLADERHVVAQSAQPHRGVQRIAAIDDANLLHNGAVALLHICRNRANHNIRYHFTNAQNAHIPFLRKITA